MKRMRKITVYLICVSLISLIGVWFCKSDLCFPIHNYFLKYDLFSILKGNKDVVVNLLMDISLSSFFAAIGFFIEYFSKMKENQRELIEFYITIRNKCFKNLFYEQNFYDDKPDEVVEICSFINKYYKLIFDYRPFMLVFKTKLYNIFRKKHHKKDESIIQKSPILEYIEDDKYILICSLFSDLYTYFKFINIQQQTISDYKHMYDTLQQKLEQVADPESLDAKTYKNYLDMSEKCLNVAKNELISRFPYNTKENQRFPKKLNMLAKIFAIDQCFPEYTNNSYTGIIVHTEILLVEDKNILYSKTDEEVKYNLFEE